MGIKIVLIPIPVFIPFLCNSVTISRIQSSLNVDYLFLRLLFFIVYFLLLKSFSISQTNLQFMFSTEVYRERRTKLSQQITSGIVLLMGNEETGMNYEHNTYRFRQDSSFLYYFGINIPGLNGIIDGDSGDEIIFGNELTMDDIVWTGPQPTLVELAAKVGVHQTGTPDKLENILKKALKTSRTIHFLPPYRYANVIKLHQWLDQPVEAVKGNASVELIKAVVAQRSVKSNLEIAEMEIAVNTSREMHIAAMKAARPDITEAHLTGLVHGKAVAAGGDLAYPIILTVNGQTLHNHYHGNILKNGQLVLGDFGGEAPSGYAGDITRTFPVDKKFTQQQKDIYEIVLDAETEVIGALKSGISYLSMHQYASQIIADGLVALGIMKGDTQEAVSIGAHALFFPHGLGHQIGLDVHDMEDLGEDLVGYDETITRSDQFGLKYLRLAKVLQPGFVLTVEPGIYFIPELIDQWREAGKFKAFINYDRLESYRNFGGIRIEDNVVITENGYRMLGDPIPKTIAEVEAIRNY